MFCEIGKNVPSERQRPLLLGPSGKVGVLTPRGVSWAIYAAMVEMGEGRLNVLLT